MTETGYYLAFTTGLLGGFGHCIGMCGPLVASYTLHSAGPGKIGAHSVPHILYNAGRITSYAAIGSVMGLTGSFVNAAGRLAGFQSSVQLLAGLLMVLMGLGISGLWKGIAALERNNSLILRAVAAVISTGSARGYYPLGLLLGFLPCGLAYSIFLGAAGTGDMLRGMFFALSFGLGTVPALLSFGLVVGYLSARARGWIYRLGGVMVTGMGLSLLIEGIR